MLFLERFGSVYVMLPSCIPSKPLPGQGMLGFKGEENKLATFSGCSQLLQDGLYLMSVSNIQFFHSFIYPFPSLPPQEHHVISVPDTSLE